MRIPFAVALVVISWAFGSGTISEAQSASAGTQGDICKAWTYSSTAHAGSGAFFSVSGSSSTDVWAVGIDDLSSKTVIAHWDGLLDSGQDE